jgi:hypothetical protein
VESTEYLHDYGRLYLTGRAARPEAVDIRCGRADHYFLGVPAPASAPEVSGGETLGEGSDARSYVYCYLNIFGEASAPSPPSRQLTVKDGDPVRVYGLAPPPDGWGVEAIAVFRSASGIRKTLEDMQAPASAWLFAGAVPPDVTETVDDLKLKDLGAALDTERCRVPPEGMRQIRHIEGTGMLCGVSGCRLHFSANMRPWEWPSENDMSFPYDITGLTSVGTDVYLSTGAGAYVVDGSVICADNLQSRRVLEARPPLPGLGCGRPHSTCATPFGMVYASRAGLALVKRDASLEVLTGRWYTEAQWARLRPDTARLAYRDGTLFCATDAVTLALEIDPKPFGDGEAGSLTTLSLRPSVMWMGDSGELFLLEGGTVSQWGAGPGLMEYDWQSADLQLQGRGSPASARVRTEGTLFTLADPETGLEFSRHVASDRPFRLGRLGRRRAYRVGFKGTGAVDSAEIRFTPLVTEAPK